MRLITAFFLSLCLFFNAAFAAGTDVCDALAGEAGDSTMVLPHGKHLGHHEHDTHDHAPAVKDPSSPSDPAAKTAHADHCHPHQCFTSVLPGEMNTPVAIGLHSLPLGPSHRLISATPSRLERPPRGTLA